MGSLSLTVIIIILTTIASIYAWNNRSIYDKWIMNPYIVDKRNEYFRFITSGFIHYDWMHLIFNMLSFYFFGENSEYYLRSISPEYGQIYFVVLYVGAIIVSEIPTYLKNRNNSGYNSLGASGAVAAIIFSCIFINPISKVYIYFIPVPGFIFGVVYLYYSYSYGRRGGDGINHDAHFYGAIFGVLFTVLIYPGSGSNFFYQISHWSLF